MMINTVKPITPSQARAAKEAMIPYFVIKAVNNLLCLHWVGQNILTLSQDQVITEIQKTQDITRGELFNGKFLDFEPNFQRSGWKVVYNKATFYVDDAPSFWEFSV